MADYHTVLSVSVEEDLLPLSALLHQRGVAHRIFEQGGRQVLKVEHAEHVDRVETLYRAWRAGEVSIELAGKPRNDPLLGKLLWRKVPVTACLIALSICGFLLIYLHAPTTWIGLLTFTPFEVSSGGLVFGAMEGQYWRLITPAFLHFGWLHIVFNGLWLWELGSKCERIMGSINMVLLFLVIALVSNTSQFLFGGPGLFGGMSGVVYGLLGFNWIAPLLQPRWAIQPARGVMLMMVAWLVICMAGFVEVMGFGAVANAAHLGGLACGALLGLAFGLLSRFSDDHSDPAAG